MGVLGGYRAGNPSKMGSKRVKNPAILGKIKTPFFKILGILGTFKNPLQKLADFFLRGGGGGLKGTPSQLYHGGPFWKILGILGTFKNPLPKLADFDLKGGGIINRTVPRLHLLVVKLF